MFTFTSKQNTIFEDALDILNNAAICIHFVGPDGTILWANKAELELLGYSKEEYIDHNIKEFHNQTNVIDDILKRLTANEILMNYEAEIRCKDGSIRIVQINSSVYKAQDKFVHTRCFTRDITDLRLSQIKIEEERQLREVSRIRAETAEEYKKLQDEFIDTICHEIRNPLNGILGSIEILEDKLKAMKWFITMNNNNLSELKIQLHQDLNEIHSSLADIKECAEHQTAITNSVLNISKLEVGKFELEKKPFYVKDVIMSAIKMFDSKLAKNKALQIRYNFPYEPVVIKTDPNQLKQILVNLVSNALKFTSQGHIIITLNNLQDNKLEISVSDTGIGMTPEEKGRLFNRFTQASSKVYSKYGGSGLGLAISYKIVQLMGGNIDVESKKGKGTTFTFTIQYDCVSEQDLQFIDHKLQEISLPTTYNIDNRSKKFLIVDDNIINQKVISSFLYKNGFQYQIVSNGQEAIEKFSKEKFDLIFMDVQMPIMDGYETTHLIREMEKRLKLNRTPIICVSGNTRSIYQHKASKVGMDDYITKPFDKEKIFEKIISNLKKSDM